ncbi:PIN domain-containing protein [Persicitalea jodogahamensis]|uniref:PIN domain-containing protein n=1 Tax=Persicitalea jodogahamensis TaxID=402147 RepID=A0A8J3GCD0_9BACT|nr:hypothetical protein [Persicitalea jodogahamensis]GHB87860.1 hypothetical protein GCM10007390_49980 [Persicitalea jodogahamensis]
MESVSSSNIDNLCARLSNNGYPVGSCVLVKPSETSELVYLFTATHCLKEVKSTADLAVEMYNPAEKGFTVFKLNDEIKKIDDPATDLSILEISAAVSGRKIPFIAVGIEYDQGEQYFFRGFPQAVKSLEPEEDYGILQTPSGRVIKGISNHTKISQKCLSEELVKGFSGSGFFVNRKNGKILIGVVSKYNEGLNCFEGVNFIGVNDLLRVGNLEEIQFSKVREAEPEISNPELVGSLNDQLEFAEELYERLMPFSALKAVDKLMVVIQDSSISALDKRKFNARSSYLRANCLREDSKVPDREYCDLFVRAYKLHPQPLKHKERAARAYHDLGQPVESSLIIEEILAEDPLNAYALAIKCQIHSETTVDASVARNPVFKRLKVHYLLKNSGKVSTDSLAEVFQEEKDSLTLPDKISRDELAYWWYLAQYIMQDCLAKIKVYNFHTPVDLKNDSALDYANKLLRLIGKRVNDTEIQDSLTFRIARFDFWFTQYLLTRNSQSVFEMCQLFIGTQHEDQVASPFDKVVLPISEDVPSRITSLCICLLEIEEFLKVTKLLEDYPKERYGLLWQFGGYAFLKLDNHEKASEYFKAYLEEIETIGESEVLNLFGYIEYFYSEKIPVSEIWESITTGRTFESEALRSLLMAFCFRFDDDKRNEVRNLCEKLETYAFTERRFQITIPICLMAIGDLERAEVMLKPLIDFSKPSNELGWYIECLYRMGNKTDQLLKILGRWRLNFEPNHVHIEKELHILGYIRDYQGIEDAARIGLKAFPGSYKYWFSLINAMVRSAKPEKIEEARELMANGAIIMAAKMEWQRAFRLAGLCTTVSLRELGREILYNVLQANFDNSSVKTAYMTTEVMEKESESYEHPEVATEDCVIRLIDDAGKDSVLSLKSSLIESNPLVMLAIGKRVGESFVHNKSLGNAKTYTITMIFDKYVGQKVLLYDELERNPATQPEVESMNIIEEGGFDGMIEKFKSTFGAAGSIRKDSVNKLFEEFKNKKIGFTELAVVIQNDYYQTWQFITSDYNDGFPVVPLNVKRLAFDENKEIVLDYSTLFTLIRIEEVTELTYKYKPFIISQRIVDSLRGQLQEMKLSRPGTHSMSITLDSVTPILIPDDFYINKENELQKIIDWVNKNTRTEVVPEMFEYCIDSPELDVNTQIVVETAMLATKPNRILLSDELFYLNYTLNSLDIKVLSIENFLLDHFRDEYKDVLLPELLKFNYRGLTVDSSVLIGLHEKSNTALTKSSNQHTLFNKSLYGICPLFNDNPNNIASVSRFLKSLYSEPFDLWYKQMTSRRVLGFLFDGANETVLPRLTKLIQRDFRLLGDHLDHVIEDVQFVLGDL